MTAAQRTYWHLEGQRRVPSDYDITTSRLLYYPARGFAVDTPVSAWHEQHRPGKILRLLDWERFRDPRETTYARYTALQHERETFVDGLFRVVDETGYDARLPGEWLEALGKWLPGLLYPCHAFSMLAAYVAQMAPAGRIVMAAMFQAADEMRRVQRLAARIQQLDLTYPNFGRSAKTDWQQHAAWQPLRRSMEHLLVTYDFDEALLALTLVYKPLFDRLWLQGFARLGESAGDTVLAKLFFSLDEDARWHEAWSHALVRLALEETATDRQAVAALVARHRVDANLALAGLAPFWTSPRTSFEAELERLNAALSGALHALGLPPTAA
jgi:toluene monooxygenase system protein E